MAIWKRLGRLIQEPGDCKLALQLAYFIWRVPDWLDRMPLPQLLRDLDAAAPQSPRSLDLSLERIRRLSRPWFKLPMLRNHNSCYLRALMFYRFLDRQAAPKRIYFVVEPPRARGERMRGHAWVTVGDELIEPPPPEVVARTQSIYSYPPRTA